MAMDLLARLESLGIRIVAEGGRLRVNSAKGQLTDELKTAIAAQKPELLALLTDRATTHSIPRVSRDTPLPLSLFQERLWIIHCLEPKNTAYNMAAVWSCPKGVHADRVAAAIDTLVRRHEILRATFRDDGTGAPSMHVLDDGDVTFRDVGALPKGELRALLEAAVEEAAHSPFDLAKEPPARFVVYHCGPERTFVLVAAHHIAVDAWSMSILERELAAACDGTLGPDPPIQYADYAAWQRRTQDSTFGTSELEWWEKHLAGIPPVSTFPHDQPRPCEPKGATRSFRWSRELSDGIRSLVREQGATVYMALLAACAGVLHWQTGQDDIVLGSPMGDRDRPELEPIIGPFVNLLVLRLDLSGDPTFAELLTRAREAVLGAHDHRHVAFEKLVQALGPARSFDHAPLFQVAVVQHNATEGGAPIASGGALFDITWFVRETDGQLEGSLEYRTDRYSRDAMARLELRLEALLAAAVADRQRRLSDISLLTADEAQQILGTFNATTREIDGAPFPAQLERQARVTPEACAIAFEGQELSYRELDRRANQLARHLRSQGIGNGVIVGLCAPRSLDMVIAAVAIQKAGAAYLPLDPDFPRERLGFMLTDSGARALVTNGEVPFTAPAGAVRIDLRTTEASISAQPGEALGDGVQPSDLAYVIYTSGSTGRPKGVRVGHAALSNFLASMREQPGIARSDVIAAVTTLSFDIAGLELYLPLTVGARIELIAKATAADGVALAAALADSGATILQATPSTWRLLVEAGWKGRPGFRALSGGEPLTRELADGIRARVAELWNLYGPTETTIWSTAERIEAGSGPIRIGRPIANTRAYVLNRHGQPLPVGAPGELWIGGAGLAEGYHGRPELTAERFRADPFSKAPGARMYRTGDLCEWDADGHLVHLGRLDHQVKVRGFRIELGEIESTLLAHPAVRHALVLAREAAPGDVRLVAYIGFHPGEDLTVSDVRRHLRTQLPDYMIPSLVVTLDAIPLTPNGKVDRAALPDPFANASAAAREHVPPEPGMEQLLAEIWRDVLKLQTVSATDNFFELGGHSLLSLRVAAILEKRTGWRMDPRILFFQNLRQAAAVATAGRTQRASS